MHPAATEVLSEAANAPLRSFSLNNQTGSALIIDSHESPPNQVRLKVVPAGTRIQDILSGINIGERTFQPVPPATLDDEIQDSMITFTTDASNPHIILVTVQNYMADLNWLASWVTEECDEYSSDDDIENIKPRDQNISTEQG